MKDHNFLNSKPKTWGIGLGRTGTTSFCVAMELLGYQRVIHNPTFDDLLNADAAADNGCIIYYKFLDFKYPGSKFILTTRDVDSWLESMKFIHAHSRKVTQVDNLPILRRMLIYETTDFDEEKYRNAYNRHHADVRRYFHNRTDDLLEMRITEGEGWEKICPFLGIEFPGIRFPHSNSKDDLSS